MNLICFFSVVVCRVVGKPSPSLILITKSKIKMTTHTRPNQVTLPTVPHRRSCEDAAPALLTGARYDELGIGERYGELGMEPFSDSDSTLSSSSSRPVICTRLIARSWTTEPGRALSTALADRS